MRGTSTQIAKYSRSTRFTGVLLAWLLVSSNVELPAMSKSVALAIAPDTPTPSVGAESEPCLSLLGESREMKKKEESVPGEHPEDPDQQTHTPSADNAERHAKRWGDITIAAPKIWQYERVNTYLDGLLRDVEAVSLADLTQLDPNAQNAGAIQFIQSALEVGVQYNQAAAVNNNLLLQSYNTQTQQQLQQLQQYNTNIQSLEQQRNNLIQQLAAATSTVNALQTQQLNGTALTPAQQTQLTSAQTLVSTLDSELATVNSGIQSAGAAPTVAAPPTLQTPTVQGPASGTSMSSTFTGLTGLLNNLPSGIQNEISSALQSPSYPATKRLDSFITLLYERLAREVSALQDDLTRDPNTLAYLVQFDVGLYPASRTKNHMARVEFELDQSQCPGCKVYSIYPGQSSYNVANYKGESRSKSFWGNLGFLIGLGVSAAYRKQEDTLHGSLVQSVYVSGFQDDTQDRRRADSKQPQRFGWNYGTAPFETYVSPGIRTTFAIITVPREMVHQSQRDSQTSVDELPPGTIKSVKPQGASTTTTREGDTIKTVASEGNTTTTIRQSPGAAQASPRVESPESLKPSCFNLDINAYWGLRDNPFYHKVHFLIPSAPVDDHEGRAIIEKRLTVELPGTAGLEGLAHVLTSEPNRLHVTSLEYNSVYSDTPTNSSTTAAAPSVGSTNSCSPGQCAAVVLALDQPIDPNLVVTVNGTLLTRVRDWRGRATSILPAPESGSDLAAGASGTPATATSSPATNTPSQPQTLFRGAPGLLESDQLGPDTWYALDSHRLLLTIASQIVPEEEFPIIRLADPSRKVLTLPNDLDQGFSEIVSNGFHIPARTHEQLQERIRNHYVENPVPLPVDKTIYNIHPAGPYPAETFLPLFLGNPERKSLYAYLGETGRQILIGFLNDSLTSENTHFHHWLPARDQVILEDRDLDLAWPLDCSPQSDELVCDIPQRQIANAYRTVGHDCTDEATCSAFDSIADLPFVSSLELWVEQYDPDGDDAFYSGSPIPLGLFPVESAVDSLTPTPPVGFVRWQFKTAAATQVTVTGCHYSEYLSKTSNPDLPDQPNVLRILGRDPTDAGTYRSLSSTADCTEFTVPTESIAKGDLVLVPAYTKSGDPLSAKTSSKTPMTIPAATLRPYFGKPIITPKWNSATPAAKQSASFPADCWVLDFTAGRLDYDDQFANSTDVRSMLNVTGLDQSGQAKELASCPAASSSPKNGAPATNPPAPTNTPAPTPPARPSNQSSPSSQTPPTSNATPPATATRPPTWDRDSKEGRIHLRMVIARKDLPDLPREIPVVRGDTAVAQLRIPQLLLPSKIKLQQIGPTQFALRGKNVNIIDAVTLQDARNTYTIRTVVGVDFALVTLPEQVSPNSTAKSGTAPTISGVALDASGESVVISGQTFGDARGEVTFDGHTASHISVWNQTTIKVPPPAGKRLGDTIKVKVTAAQQASDPATFTVGKTFAADCKAAADTPCIAKVTTDSSSPQNIVITGENFGEPFGVVTFDGRAASNSGEWNSTTIKLPVPATQRAGVVIKVLPARQSSDLFSFILGTPGGASKTTSTVPTTPPATAPSSPTAAGDQPTTSIPVGTYAVIPLFRTGATTANPDYLPLDVSDALDKPLFFTVAKAAVKPPATTTPSATTTITVTKSPPPASTAAGSTPSGTPQPPANPQ